MSYQTTNTRCLIKTAKELGLSVKILDKNHNLVRIGKGKRALLFANYSTPFNSAAVEKICKDKEFTHFILDKKIRMPKAKGFFDPHYKSVGEIGDGMGTYEKLTNEIINSFSFPLILKPNSKSRGRNVKICRSKTGVLNTLKNIFRHTEDYDYVTLAEEYIPIDKEFRVVVFWGNILLAYEKDFSSAKFVGNLSPLHWDGAKAVIIHQKSVLDSIKDFIKPIFKEFQLNYAGLDIVMGKDGKYFLLEINTQIGFASFVRDNGEKTLIEMYSKILKQP